MRRGRVYPDVLTTAPKGLLDENAFYFAQNGRGIPRFARNDGAGSSDAVELGVAILFWTLGPPVWFFL